MGRIAIIGGSGFDQFQGFIAEDKIQRSTPYGEHSGPVLAGNISNYPCVFMPRHNEGHQLAPHLINYRANLWLLKQLGVSQIIACNAVGGITSNMAPDTWVVPDQIIDYSYGRQHTFYDGQPLPEPFEPNNRVDHIDFTQPYSEPLRQKLIQFLNQTQQTLTDHGVYGCTQGPRLESAAEVKRLERDGCDIVGMTGMPEATLAKEIGIAYACLAIVVNWGAGIGADELSIESIMASIHNNMDQLKRLLPELITSL